MTVTEVKTKFLIELDAVASGAAPGFTDAEISELVDKAQKDLIQQLAVAKKWDDLYTLIKIENLSVDDDGNFGSKSAFVTVPTDFGYYIKSSVTIANRSDINSGVYKANCDEISIGIVDKFIPTPFNAPFFKNPVVFLTRVSDELNILYDSHTTISLAAGGFQLTYVKIPTDFSIGSNKDLELPETLHENIVEMAVKEAAKSLTIAKMTNQ